MSIKQSGGDVIIEAGSEKEAAEIAAKLKANAVDDNGFIGWMTRLYHSTDKIAENQPAFEFVSYCLLALASIMEYMSWANLFPGKGLPVVFGLVGVCVLLGTKFSFARWARAVNNGHKKRIELYSRNALTGLAVCALMASQFIASRIENENQGATDIRSEIAEKTQEINELRRKIQLAQSQVSVLSSSDIEFEIQILENQPALNSQGVRTGKTVKEHVGDCIGSSYYKDTYCEEIIAQKRLLNPRKEFEIMEAELAEARDKRDALQENAPNTSGAVALGRQFASGGDFFITIIPGVFFMFIVVGAMGFLTFLSKWNPKEDEVT